MVTGKTVSRRHCRLAASNGNYTIEDLDSANGTFVNGRRIDANLPVPVQPSERIVLGRTDILPWDRVLLLAATSKTPSELHPGTRTIRIGRSPDNDILLDHPAVSGHHARIVLGREAALIEDLGSLNGTALGSLDNRIASAPLSIEDWVFFGSYRVAASQLLAAPEHAASETWKPENASVVFTDIIGFTTLTPPRQMEARLQLEKCVESSEAFLAARRAGEVIARPTGDGMALVFFTHPSTAAECAVQLARFIAAERNLFVRIGINQGTVYRVKDINGNDDVNGSGINMAQRVMDCGDSGDIIVSSSVAEALRGTMDWHDRLRPLGARLIKHGDSIEIFALLGHELGETESTATGAL